MIVKHKPQGWEIVSHYTHGLLSGKIASHINAGLLPDHKIDFLTGVIEHDDHLLDFEEGDYLTENGTPKDFTMEEDNEEESLEHARTVYSNAMQKSQLIALMVGRHLEFLYEGLADEYGPMADFLKFIGKSRKHQRKLYGLNKDKEDNLYEILRFSDRASLILCQDLVPGTGRRLEINTSIEGETYFILRKRGEDGCLTVRPWPFEKKSFHLELEYRVLENMEFKDNKELKEGISNATIELRKIKFEE